jgi:hypothetical protein
MVHKAMLEHSPQSEYAQEARAGLELALQLFRLGSDHGSGRAKQALVTHIVVNPHPTLNNRTGYIQYTITR